jgi:hypothetical protein
MSLRYSVAPLRSAAASAFNKQPFASSFLTQRLTSTTPFTRSFSASTANMVQKVYFDLTWKGPTIKTNEKGDVTSNDKTNTSQLLLSLCQAGSFMLTILRCRPVPARRFRAFRRRCPQDR